MKLKKLKKKVSLYAMHKQDKGLVLIATLALVAILALVSTAAFYTTNTDIKISGNYKTSVQAFYLAEAGINDGIARLMNGSISDTGAKLNPVWNTASTYSSTGANNSFTVKHQIIGGSVVTDDSGVPLFLINSTGTSSTSTKQVEAVVRLIYALPFTKALEGCDGVTISSGVLTDSYDSAIGTYTVIPAGTRKDHQENAWARDRGNVGTANAGADVFIDGTAQIHGNARATRFVTTSGTGIPTTGLGTPANLTGYKGSPDTNHTNAVIYGIPTENSPPTPCDPLDTTTLFNTAANIISTNNNADIINLSTNKPYNTTTKNFDLPTPMGEFTLGDVGQSKKYHFNSFTLSSNTKLYTNGNVTLYVSGDFTTPSNSEIKLNSGSSLTLYGTGTINIQSNTILNPGAPTNFMIYSSASSTSSSDYKVTLNSNADFVGNIYAPNAAIHITSNHDIMGAIKGKYINCSSNAKFHYDEALGRLGGYPVIGYKIISWREVN